MMNRARSTAVGRSVGKNSRPPVITTSSRTASQTDQAETRETACSETDRQTDRVSRFKGRRQVVQDRPTMSYETWDSRDAQNKPSSVTAQK